MKKFLITTLICSFLVPLAGCIRIERRDRLFDRNPVLEQRKEKREKRKEEREKKRDERKSKKRIVPVEN